MNIVVLDGYTLNPGDNPWDGVAALGTLTVYDRTAPHDILDRAAEAEILLTNKIPLTAKILAELPKLRFVSVTATGCNVVDLPAARDAGIPVSNVPEYGTASVAQYVFALLLELSSHVGLHDAAVKDGAWQKKQDFSFWNAPMIELEGRVMGIVGYGRIGRRVGAIAHAFGMQVMAYSRSERTAPEYVAWSPLERIFAEADYVSLHCPLMEENESFVDACLLAQMKSTAFLINTARGGLIDEQALSEALHAGRLAGAALDVVSREPISPDNVLLTAPNCLITPHVAWATLAARKRLMEATAENVRAFIEGRPINVVNGLSG